MQYQEHILKETADRNLGIAEECAKEGEIAEQRVLLQAALLLAKRIRSKSLTKKIESKLAKLPATDGEISPFRKELSALVAQLGNEYGSECTNDGEVHQTTANTIEAAVVECFGVEQTVFDRPDFTSSFKKGRKAAAHRKFCALVEQHKASYILAGDEECFSPNESDRGGFRYCFFFKQESGKNLLASFECAET
ncbi:MAG: hypothetical protein K2W82_15640 [Candidatus Obscuribacterales bacterium]|nr:hypothetical protein [Candidatus Obscuribacterales bacterium]